MDARMHACPARSTIHSQTVTGLMHSKTHHFKFHRGEPLHRSAVDVLENLWVRILVRPGDKRVVHLQAAVHHRHHHALNGHGERLVAPAVRDGPVVCDRVLQLLVLGHHVRHGVFDGVQNDLGGLDDGAASAGGGESVPAAHVHFPQPQVEELVRRPVWVFALRQAHLLPLVEGAREQERAHVIHPKMLEQVLGHVLEDEVELALRYDACARRSANGDSSVARWLFGE